MTNSLNQILIFSLASMHTYFSEASLSMISHSKKPVVIITGGTGVLGQELIRESISIYKYPTYFSYRDPFKLVKTKAYLTRSNNNIDKSNSTDPIAKPFYLNLDIVDTHLITSTSTTNYLSSRNDIQHDMKLSTSFEVSQLNSSFISFLDDIITDQNQHQHQHDNVNSCDLAQMNNEIILINNAAICQSGNDKDTFIKTLFINCIFPFLLIRYILSKCQSSLLHSSAASTTPDSTDMNPFSDDVDVDDVSLRGASDSNGDNNRYHDDSKENTNGEDDGDYIRKLTVINISSGDGELICLHSQLQTAIENLSNLQEWEEYVFTSLSTHDTQFEYAIGETPAYSFSKALLNVLTRLFHQEYQLRVQSRVQVQSQHDQQQQSPSNPNDLSSRGHSFITGACSSNNKEVEKSTDTNIHNRDIIKQVELRVLSICPGNFLSPISTAQDYNNNNNNNNNINNNVQESELISIPDIPVVSAVVTESESDSVSGTHAVRNATDVAREIFEIALDAKLQYPSGQFYRYKTIIPW